MTGHVCISYSRADPSYVDGLAGYLVTAEPGSGPPEVSDCDVAALSRCG